MPNGQKYLIVGNHDNKKAIKQLAGHFKYIGDMHNIRYEKLHFVLCHYPLYTWNRSFHGSINLHGHIHNGQLNRPNQYNVGVDMNDYAPIHVEEMLININELNSNLETNKVD